MYLGLGGGKFWLSERRNLSGKCHFLFGSGSPTSFLSPTKLIKAAKIRLRSSFACPTKSRGLSWQEKNSPNGGMRRLNVKKKMLKKWLKSNAKLSSSSLGLKLLSCDELPENLRVFRLKKMLIKKNDLTHLATLILFLINYWINKDWAQESILTWLWNHFRLVFLDEIRTYDLTNVSWLLWLLDTTFAIKIILFSQF